jgi:hypothetical protein
VARRDFIEAVRRHNTELRTFRRALGSTIYRSDKPMETFTVAETLPDRRR